jgi:hypothetical protein
MSKTNNIYTSIVMLAAILLLAGCSKQEPAPAAAVATAAPAAAPTSAAPAAPATPKWLASTTGDIPGITVAIQELKRGPNALKLKFVVLNESQKDIRWEAAEYQDIKLGEDPDAREGWVESVRDVHLIDATNRKKYFVVKDSEGACVCSRHMPWVSPGSQLGLWAEYPLPPDDVQKINVEVPHFPPMEDIPITR